MTFAGNAAMNMCATMDNMCMMSMFSMRKKMCFSVIHPDPKTRMYR